MKCAEPFHSHWQSYWYQIPAEKLSPPNHLRVIIDNYIQASPLFVHVPEERRTVLHVAALSSQDRIRTGDECASTVFALLQRHHQLALVVSCHSSTYTRGDFGFMTPTWSGPSIARAERRFSLCARGASDELLYLYIGVCGHISVGRHRWLVGKGKTDEIETVIGCRVVRVSDGKIEYCLSLLDLRHLDKLVSGDRRV